MSSDRVGVMHRLTKNEVLTIKEDTPQESLALSLAVLRAEPAERHDIEAMKLSISNEDVQYVVQTPFLRDAMLPLYEYDAFSACSEIKSKHIKDWRAGTGMVRHQRASDHCHRSADGCSCRFLLRY